MKKKLRITFNAPVTLTFTGICLAALILNYITKGFTNDLLFSVYRSSMLNPFTYFRFIGHVFGHADFDHFIGNMMTLLIIAPLLEEKYGSANIILVILTTALSTGILSFILFPNIQLLGASGVVFAFILLSSITDVHEGEIPMTFILVAVLYLGQQILSGIFIDDNISNFGHFLGGTCGSIIGFKLNSRKGLTPPTDTTYYG
ncbi:MAG: rhomboid family intramembrane serine protease [Clostridia bacterium]|nr:rhomboid family intramembrane serine protease [Clostridia bacterium]